MSEQLSVTPAQTSTLSSPPVKLWTPRAVGYIAFLLGFPGGFVLAALNRFRMGRTNPAISILAVGAMQAFVLSILFLLIPGQAGNILSFVVNIATAFYLLNLTEKDILAFKAINREVQNAHWLIGTLIALLTLVLYLAFGAVLIILFSLLGIPIAE